MAEMGAGGGRGAGGGQGAGGGWKLAAVAGLVGISIGAGAMLVANGYFVRSYLLENPEIIPEAMERLQEKQMASALGPQRAALERPFHGAWAGAQEGDVVLVEFFDYACGYCRASNPDVERLLSEDPRLKVVWRELPVLGPSSESASAVSMAAARQGRFRQFHDRLFALGRPTDASIAEATRSVGIQSGGTLTAEDRAEIGRNLELARAIGASGTPTFVVGDRVMQGAVGYQTLKDAIADARAGS